MSDPPAAVTDTAAALRQAFDRSFAEARPAAPPAVEELLAITLGDEPYALRLSEIDEILAARRITRLPGGGTALLGIAGCRGTIVPVYDLRALLGCGRAGPARWFAMTADATLAFAFETLAAHLRVPHDAFVAHQTDARQRTPVRDFVRLDDELRPIVHLPSLIEALQLQVPATGNKRNSER
ncbi:MAG TPA: chemotaxis protein CheW [Stellaceae bacterium]|jgi:purine-binding chemotaxis protein CheW|nr:chemotaxis protein CheW [Stellaceae bacterium]